MLTGAAGMIGCLVHHRTACHGARLAPGDWQYGWPFVYGFDQGDVLGEFFWSLASFRPVAGAADAAIGVALGMVAGLVLYRLPAPWLERAGATATPRRTGVVAAAILAAAGVAFAAAPRRVLGPPISARFQLEMLGGALAAFRERAGRYPTPEEGLAVLAERGLLVRVPSDPWGRPYLYALETQGAVARSLGADGQVGGRVVTRTSTAPRSMPRTRSAFRSDRRDRSHPGPSRLSPKSTQSRSSSPIGMPMR